MPKIEKALQAIARIIRNPWLLNKILEEDKHWKELVEKKYNLPQGFPVVRPEVLFGDFSESVSPFAFLEGGSNPTDLALLKKLARTFPACSYFEIGTWRGESVANVADVAAKCVTLNLSKAEMTAMGLDRQYIDLHGHFSKSLSNVVHLEGNTRSFDFSSPGQKFDLVFIDGDHRFEMVKNDTMKVFEHLVHENSIVVWHDYARGPEIIRYEVMAGILEGCPKHLHQNIRQVAHTICAVYFPVNHRGMPPETLSIPKGYFKIDLEFMRDPS